MEDAIKREESSDIAHKLNSCKKSLQRGNIFSCIVCFSEALEKMLKTRMLPSDEKELKKEINIFQKNLSESKTFRDIFGPVTFRDDDIVTALAFMKQLIQLKEEESQALLAANAEQKDGPPLNSSGVEETGAQIQQIKILIEKGDYATAQELIAGQEEIMELLLEEYNASGIRLRLSGNYDQALIEFKKALVVQPSDEGLYYNIARVCIAKEEWKTAAETVCEGLRINPHFEEGIKLLKYIRETGKIDS